jgi:hypothetical protein
MAKIAQSRIFDGPNRESHSSNGQNERPPNEQTLFFK